MAIVLAAQEALVLAVQRARSVKNPLRLARADPSGSRVASFAVSGARTPRGGTCSS